MQEDVKRPQVPEAEAFVLDAAFLSGRRATMAMQIYQHLRGLILSGEYKPLHALSEIALAQGLGVSRTPVREAFGKLEEEGLVAILPQYGTFVAPIRLDRVAGDQFVREAIECASVREAAARCTPADAARLQESMDRQRVLESDKDFFEADEALHRSLMALAGHEAAWHVVDAAKVNIDRIRRLSVREMFKRQAILCEHGQIVDAVIAGDAEAAAGAMRAHLRGVFASSENMMKLHPEFFQATKAHTRPARRRRPAGRAID